MAEKNDEMEPEVQVAVPVINPDDLGGDDDDQGGHRVDVQHFHDKRDFVWSLICKFVNHLSEDEINEASDFCGCVDQIIESYKEKAREVKGYKNMIKWMAQKTNEDKKTIKQLRTTISSLKKQLASSICKECEKMKIAEQQFRSLSVQEQTTELAKGQSEVDGGQPVENIETQTTKILGKRPHENEERDEDETDSSSEDSHHFKCPHAACGLDALLYLFYKIQINFCPTKFIQKVGKLTGYKGISCTQILNNLKDKEGRFLEKIYYSNITEGEHSAVLNEAKRKFQASGHDVGVLSYSTVAYKHCVNLYKSKGGKIKTYDANRGKKYIEDWNQAYYVEVCVLKFGIINGALMPHISVRWSECHSRHCKTEMKKLIDPVFKSSSGDESSSALQ